MRVATGAGRPESKEEAYCRGAVDDFVVSRVGVYFCEVRFVRW